MARQDIRKLLATKPGELWGVPMPAGVRASPFLRAMRRAALTYLLRADALPRDHVVWHHHSVQTINFYRAAELAMRDLRIRPNDRCSCSGSR